MNDLGLYPITWNIRVISLAPTIGILTSSLCLGGQEQGNQYNSFMCLGNVLTLCLKIQHHFYRKVGENLYGKEIDYQVIFEAATARFEDA